MVVEHDVDARAKLYEPTSTIECSRRLRSYANIVEFG